MYDSYDDWYDNGPGSEAFKRKILEGQREFYKDYEIIIRRKKKDEETTSKDTNS